jgi:hypothetical protein
MVIISKAPPKSPNIVPTHPAVKKHLHIQTALENALDMLEAGNRILLKQ